MTDRPNIEWIERELAAGGNIPPDKVRSLVLWIEHLERPSIANQVRDKQLEHSFSDTVDDLLRNASPPIVRWDCIDCAKRNESPTNSRGGLDHIECSCGFIMSFRDGKFVFARARFKRDANTRTPSEET